MQMKKTVRILIITLFVSSLSFSQNRKKTTIKYKYFDENYQPISKTKFENRKRKNRFLSVQGDSIHHKILSVRAKEAILLNRNYLDSLLTLSTNKKIDSTKPLVIIYYPGKDPCNSSGIYGRRTRKKWYDLMEEGINKIKESNIVYVYKNNEGLYRKNDGFKNWIKDPKQTVENLFFKRHYPCGSFVVISEKSKFISYFGEFPKELVWKVVEVLTTKKKD